MTKITLDYSKELAKFLCSQLYCTNINKAYPKCQDLTHKDCNCKEIYPDFLSTENGTLEEYLTENIFEFIEK